MTAHVDTPTPTRPDARRYQRRRPFFLILWAILAVATARIASAQSVPSTPAVRTLLGDVALILRADGPQTLRISVAGATRSMSLVVRNSDALRWADSASVLLSPQRTPSARAKRTARDGVQRSRAILEEPGMGVGSFMLTRIDSAGARRFLLFADDSALSGIREPLQLEDAKLLVRLVRRAASPPPAPRKRRKPSGAGRQAPAGTARNPVDPMTARDEGYPR